MDELIEYLANTPENTNPNVVRDMLENTNTDSNKKLDLCIIEPEEDIYDYIFGHYDDEDELRMDFLDYANIYKFSAINNVQELKPNIPAYDFDIMGIIERENNSNISLEGIKNIYTVNYTPPTETEIENFKKQISNGLIERPGDAVYCFNIPVTIYVCQSVSDDELWYIDISIKDNDENRTKVYEGDLL